MGDMEELIALRRLAELEAKAGGQATQPVESEPSFWQNLAGGAKVGLDQLGQRIKQAGSDALQNNYYAVDMGVMDTSSPDYAEYKVKNEADIRASRNAPVMKTAGGKVGNFVTKAAPAVAASFLPGGQSLAGSVAISSASGAAEPVLESDGEAAWKNALLSGIGGASGYGLSKGASVLANRYAAKAAADPRIAQLELLKSEGVVPTIGQTMGGITGNLEEKAMSVPILGNVIKGARDRAASELEQAAYNRALTPIGQKLPNGSVGRDALNFTENAIKQSYDDVLNKIGAVVPDQQFSSNISRITSMVDNMQIPDAAKAKFRFALSSVDGALQNGAFTSTSFKQAESALGRNASTLGRAGDVFDNSLEPAVKQVQSELRELLKRQAGQYADDLASANKAWANFKRPQRAATSVAAEGGEFTPAQLQNAVKALDKSNDKASFARGDAIMQDLGDAGASILKNKLPNSGTADRLIPWGLLGGAGYMNLPVTAGVVGGGSLLYMRPVTKALNGLLGPSPNGSATLNMLANPNFQRIAVPTGALLAQ